MKCFGEMKNQIFCHFSFNNRTRNMSLSSDQRNKISRMVIIFIAIIGCSIQLRTTLLSYFHYESVSRTIYIPPKIQEVMSISLCVSYVDILNYSSTKELSKIAKLDRDVRFRKV